MLEQFDLDVAFASPSTCLARLLHKCYQDKPPTRRRGGEGWREEVVEEAVDDLVYFVREAAEVSKLRWKGGREGGSGGRLHLFGLYPDVVLTPSFSRPFHMSSFLTFRSWASPFLLRPRRQQCRARRGRKRETGRSGPSAFSLCWWTSLPAGREQRENPPLVVRAEMEGRAAHGKGGHGRSSRQWLVCVCV